MPTPRALALALFATAAVTSFAQQLVLKAGTPITVANNAEFIPRQAHLGDTVDFLTAYPVRVGKTAVIPKGAVLHGHVTALQPRVEITLDPLQVNGASVAFTGHPFEQKGAAHDDVPGTPPEFAGHYQLTTKEKFELAGAIVIIVPIAVVVAAVALPIYAVVVLTHPHGHKHAGTKSLITLAQDTTFDTAALPAPKLYTGLPIIYLVDRYRTDHAQLLCNAQPFFAKAFRQQLALRVAPQTYTFSATEQGQSSATVDAQQNGRYLVYRDKLGLHTENLSEHPDLLMQGLLPGEEKSSDFFFDYTRIPANQLSGIDEQRSKGGCGLTPLLHTRTPAPQP